jgi:hypothetical protein
VTELFQLVEELTQPHRTPVYWHGEFIRFRPDRPLLDALREARTGNIGNAAGGSGTAAHERSTLNIAASQLWGDIHKRIRAWAINADVPRHWAMTGGQPIDWTDPNQLLRAWHVRILSNANFDERAFTSTLRGWITQISDLCIDPPRRWSVAAPCPLCDARWVIDTGGVGWVALNADGNFLNPPINATNLAAITHNGQRADALGVIERDPADNSVTVCRNCEAVWAGVHGARELRIAIDDAAKSAA